MTLSKICGSAVIALLAVTACKKGDDKAAPSTTDETKGGTAETKPAAAPAARAWKKVPSMGIEVEVAADADVQDNTASAGFPSSTIYSADTPTTFIFGHKGDLAESMSLSKDFASTKARLQKEHNGFKAFTKEQEGADGAFELRYTGTSMGDNAPLYGVTIRSSVAGLTIDCQTNAKSEAEIEATVKLCKSIRAAK